MSKKSFKKSGMQVSLAIVKNKIGLVLIVERSHAEVGTDGSRLVWAFPGGEIEEGETPEEAVIREVSKETGYNIKILKMISERSHPHFDVHLFYFAAEMADFKVKAIQDVHEVIRTKWVEPKDLKNYFTTDLDPGVAKYLGI